jgi:hypothetical protein
MMVLIMVISFSYRLLCSLLFLPIAFSLNHSVRFHEDVRRNFEL